MRTNYKLKYIIQIIVFTTILLESSTRIYILITKKDINAFKQTSNRYTGSHFTGYKLSPNFILNHNTLKESINSLGFKSPEIKIKKMENTYRIICIGGSVVYGSFDNEKTWPSFLQRLSNNKKFTEKKVEVIQEIHSVEGWNLLKDYRYNWERRDLEREQIEIKMKMKEILSEIVSSIV